MLEHSKLLSGWAVRLRRAALSCRLCAVSRDPPGAAASCNFKASAAVGTAHAAETLLFVRASQLSLHKNELNERSDPETTCGSPLLLPCQTAQKRHAEGPSYTVHTACDVCTRNSLLHSFQRFLTHGSRLGSKEGCAVASQVPARSAGWPGRA